MDILQNKCKTINRFELNMFQACEECKAISRKLYEKPNSIEELTEHKEWMKQVPDQLKAHEVKYQSNTCFFFLILKSMVDNCKFTLIHSLINEFLPLCVYPIAETLGRSFCPKP